MTDDVWGAFGFRERPYRTKHAPATEEGDQLVVGREIELARLENRIVASGTHPTLEGDNGVGKTSLVSVVCYRLRSAFDKGRAVKPFIPLELEDFFQLDPDSSA